MISHSHKFIFFHGFKTAGVSIRISLQDLIHKDEFWHANNQHAPATRQLGHYGKEIFNNYLKFSVVRNPWDRMVSAYFYFRSRDIETANRQYKNVKYCQEHTFPEFVFFHKVLSSTNLLSVNRKLVTDYIIKFENLDNDFNDLCKRLNIPKTNLKHITHNTSRPRGHYSTFYDTKTMEEIKKFYKKDIKNFVYTFDNKK